MGATSNPLAAGTNLGVPVISAPPVPVLPSLPQTGIVSQQTALSPVPQPGVTATQAANQQAATMAGIAANPATAVNPATPVAPMPAATAVCSFSNLSGCFPSFSVGRTAAFVLGLIFIAAGLFMLKSVEATVVNVGKTAEGAAALA